MSMSDQELDTWIDEVGRDMVTALGAVIDEEADLRRLKERAGQPDAVTAIPSSCGKCGAPRRPDGTRTCSPACVRGVDPRAAS